MASSTLAFCGAHPYFLAKEDCLSSRGFLNPRTWHEIHLLASDPRATAINLSGYSSRRVEIVSQGVVIVLVDHLDRGMPIVLTAFVPKSPAYPAGIIKAAACKVDVSNLVDLDARLRGEA